MPGALACERCHALVHADEMDRLAAEARALEAQSRLMEARDRWVSILPLLPYESKQAEWIREHARQLESTAPAAQRPGDPNAKGKWAKRLEPLGPVAVLLGKFKIVAGALLKLKFLLSFASFIGVYLAIWGPKFGVGFALLVLIHEMGHYIDIKRRGLPVDMPMFLPGLGAYVRWQAMGVSLETRAAVSLAGLRVIVSGNGLPSIRSRVACARPRRYISGGIGRLPSQTDVGMRPCFRTKSTTS